MTQPAVHHKGASTNAAPGNGRRLGAQAPRPPASSPARKTEPGEGHVLGAQGVGKGIWDAVGHQPSSQERLDLTQRFALAGGSIIGKEHRRDGKPNQDAYYLRATSALLIALVADGCGDPRSPHSQVGAALGVRLLAERIARQVESADYSVRTTTDAGLRGGAAEPVQSSSRVVDGADPSVGVVDVASAAALANGAFWQRVRRDVLAELRVLARRMGGSLAEVVRDYFLFTILGAVITPRQAVFFSLGDGVLCVNDELIVLGPYPGNAPPYLAYGLLDGALTTPRRDALAFQVQRALPTADLRSFLLGTDGVGELLRCAEQPLPGRTELLGPLSQFWREDRYFANPHAVSRRLAVVNQERQQPDWAARRVVRQHGLLADDTTVVVGRRRALAEADDA